MIGLRVTVPVACFRRGMAREFLETEELPPPSTCYGFLLSMVGERRRARHMGARVAPALVSSTPGSVVVRTLWRIKELGEDKKTGRLRLPGTGANSRPDYQQLLTGVELVVWLDSSGEDIARGPSLEQRVASALNPAKRGAVDRFGALSLGESTHLVNEVSPFPGDATRRGRLFVTNPESGRLSLPVWVDHVGSAGTRHVVGDLVDAPLTPPDFARMPVIERPVTSPNALPTP